MTSALRAFEHTVLTVREPGELQGSLVCSMQHSDIPFKDKTEAKLLQEAQLKEFWDEYEQETHCAGGS